jgi:ubiquinol-cytochrome c reductase cytochrome c subunit
MPSMRSFLPRRLARGPVLLFAIALVAFSILFLSESPAHSDNSLVSTNPTDISAGGVLYEEHCQSCHGYEGEGGVVTNAPALTNVGAAAADFYLSTGRMPLNAPNAEALRHHQDLFTAAQTRQLVAYINALPVITGQNQFGPTIPTVLPLCQNETTPTTLTRLDTPDCVTLSEGQQLYAINCAQCHQAAGSGDMLSKGNVIPSLANATLVQTVEAPTIGPKPMPVFAGALSPAQLSAIAQYVHYLHAPNNSGGEGISHFGPVAEGFVGIFMGFVVLWFASRMIGNRG